MVFKHIIIAGGGPTIFQSLGVFKILTVNKVINLDEIKSIYGTSAGAIIGFLISLKFDWDTIYDFMIKRPWDDVFNFRIDSFLEAYNNKGFFTKKTFERSFKSLFNAKNIPLNVTLKQYYEEHSNIELHFFTFDINMFNLVDVSYLTHPDIELLTAIQMSCCLPILVCPIVIEDKCFIDGGIVCNYPLRYCINDGKKEDEMFGIRTTFSQPQKNVNDDSNLIEYFLHFFLKLIRSMNKDGDNSKIENEIVLETVPLSFESIKKCISDIKVRSQLVEKGENVANKYIENKIK